MNNMLRASDIILGPRNGPARVYITSPDFGIDLSVPWLNATFERQIESRSILGDGMYFDTMLRDHGFKLQIECGYPGNGAYFAVQDDHHSMMGRKMFLLDEGIPPLPERPIWLPPGVWECAYCSTIQGADLLQCRNCGASRLGESR